jgi:hypothetical protein
VALSNLPAKVIAKAFRAGFHLTTQRAFPWPVGSSDRVVRYTLLDVRASGQAALIPLGAHRVCSTLPTGRVVTQLPMIGTSPAGIATRDELKQIAEL